VEVDQAALPWDDQEKGSGGSFLAYQLLGGKEREKQRSKQKVNVGLGFMFNKI